MISRLPKSSVRKQFQSLLPMSLIVGLLATTIPVANAAPGGVNSVNDGKNIADGTYYNTAGNKTVFKNTAGNGLRVGAGTTVRGLEVSNAASPATSRTGNGGHLHFDAAGQIVRVDGHINVNALMNGSGAYTGNGGKVTVNAAYLYQNGMITANGNNGGFIQFNVGAATFTGNSKTEAIGTNGHGGVITMQADDAVDIQRGAILDTSGEVIGTFDTNVISIEGGLVNMDGILRADGMVVDNRASQGGLVRLIAHGDTDTTPTVDLVNASDMFEAAEKIEIAVKQNLLDAGWDGDVYHRAQITAYGADSTSALSDGGAGGTVLLSAVDDIWSDGVIFADGGDGYSGSAPTKGGDGGSVFLAAADDILNTCIIRANGGRGGDNTHHLSYLNLNNGPEISANFVPETPFATKADARGNSGANGGNGGLVAFSYGNTFLNTHSVQAKGGQGGKGVNAYSLDTALGGVDESAYAHSIAYGGAGGNGGNGGLAVFSGPSNPVSLPGAVLVDTSGGQGGPGGDATAQSWAIATNRVDPFAKNYAHATALAVAGDGGLGGAAGTIVVPDPGTLALGEFQSKAGGNGDAGKAVAEAYAIGINGANSVATGLGNADSTVHAVSIEINNNGVNNSNPDLYYYGFGANTGEIFTKSPERIANVINNVEPGFNIVYTESTDGVPYQDQVSNTDGDKAWVTSVLNNKPAGSLVTGPNQYDTTNPVEILTNQNNVFVLSRSDDTSLTNQLASGVVRGADTAAQDGTLLTLGSITAGVNAGDITNFAYGNPTGTPLTVDSPLISSSLNTVNILNTGGSTASPVNAEHNGFPGQYNLTGITRGTGTNQFSSQIFWIGEAAGPGGPGGGPGEPGGPGTPGTPSTPGGRLVGPSGGTPVASSQTPTPPDLLGLFQEGRNEEQLNVNRPQPDAFANILIGFDQPNMFRMSTYNSVTDRILSLSIKEYNRQLSLGKPAGVAAQETESYMKAAGIDPLVAKAILEEVEAGNLTAAPEILSILETLAESTENLASL